MTAKAPLTPEARALLTEQPRRFERFDPGDGPTAHGRLFDDAPPEQLDLLTDDQRLERRTKAGHQ